MCGGADGQHGRRGAPSDLRRYPHQRRKRATACRQRQAGEAGHHHHQRARTDVERSAGRAQHGRGTLGSNFWYQDACASSRMQLFFRPPANRVRPAGRLCRANTPPAPLTVQPSALAWSPDGTVLAIGLTGPLPSLHHGLRLVTTSGLLLSSPDLERRMSSSSAGHDGSASTDADTDADGLDVDESAAVVGRGRADIGTVASLVCDPSGGAGNGALPLGRSAHALRLASLAKEVALGGGGGGNDPRRCDTVAAQRRNCHR